MEGYKRYAKKRFTRSSLRKCAVGVVKLAMGAGFVILGAYLNHKEKKTS